MVKPDTSPSTFAEIDINYVSDRVMAETLRQTELHAEAMFRAGLGMDQKAVIIGAAFTAAAAAFVAGGLSAAGVGAHVIRASACASALFFATGGAFCIWAGRPQLSMMPGIEPDDWASQSFLSQRIKNIRAARIRSLSTQISSNERSQRANARAIGRGLLLAILAPLIGLICYVVLSVPVVKALVVGVLPAWAL